LRACHYEYGFHACHYPVGKRNLKFEHQIAGVAYSSYDGVGRAFFDKVNRQPLKRIYRDVVQLEVGNYPPYRVRPFIYRKQRLFFRIIAYGDDKPVEEFRSSLDYVHVA